MQESNDLIKAICNMNFDKAGVGQFSLVDSRSNYVDLLLNMTMKQAICCQLEEAMKISDEKIRRELVKAFAKICFSIQYLSRQICAALQSERWENRIACTR